MKKRLLSLALSLVLCLGLAAPAYAASGNFKIENGVLIEYPYTSPGGNVTIPSGVTEIGQEAFANWTGLTSVTISNGVTKIGVGAFVKCDNLTSVTIPNSVTTISGSAFRFTGLTSVTIPNSVTEIGKWAFYGCTDLASVTIGSGVTVISDNMFQCCTSLTSVTIPSSVTTIGDYAFDDCTSLTDVYYTGSKAQWDAITINRYNDPLKTSTIHCNSNGQGGTTTPTTPSVPTTNGGSTVSNWAVGNINNAEAAGLVPQWLVGADLTKSISRGDFAAAAVGLYRAMGGSTAGVNAENPFSDVDSSLNSYEDILLAKALGIANGKGGDRFDPNGTLTREEAAVMLCNVYKALGKTIPTVSATAFADDGGVSSWAKSAVAFMNQRGVVNGKGENKYDPQGLNAAEEALTMALNMLNKLK